MGSNGLTSARHDVFGKELAVKYPESFDPMVPENLVYSGACAVHGGLGLGILWGAACVLSIRRTRPPTLCGPKSSQKGV